MPTRNNSPFIAKVYWSFQNSVHIKNSHPNIYEQIKRIVKRYLDPLLQVKKEEFETLLKSINNMVPNTNN